MQIMYSKGSDTDRANRNFGSKYLIGVWARGKEMILCLPQTGCLLGMGRC